MTTSDIVSKLWHLCNIHKDEGVTYHLTNPPFGTKKGGGLPSRDDFTYSLNIGEQNGSPMKIAACQ